MRARPGRAALLAAPVVAGALLAVAGPLPATAAPGYEMPFSCKQRWVGDTRTGHSPSYWSLDFNRTDDLGAKMLASAAGTVSTVGHLGSASYGTYVVLDHGGGRSTLYAHLQREFVSVGQVLDQGELVGLVGDTGNVTGPHLHYEQREDGSDVPVRFHGSRYRLGTAQASRNCEDTPVVGDWDRDGKDELGVYRRLGHARFRLATAKGTVQKVGLGRSTDQPLVGDWDGDGRDDLGVRRGKERTLRLRSGDGHVSLSRLPGPVGARAVAGDWDGDGRDEVGLWRAQRSRFVLPLRGTTRVHVGSTGSIPVVGDWNGDGRDDLAAYTRATRTWTVKVLTADGPRPAVRVRFGSRHGWPVAGDWNGDGRDDLGMWSPGKARWTLRTASRIDGDSPAVRTAVFGRKR